MNLNWILLLFFKCMPESVDFIWSCCLISSRGWVPFIRTMTRGSVVINWRCFLWRKRHFEREGWVPTFFSCTCLIMHFCSRVCLSGNQLFLNHTVTCKSLFYYHQSLTVCNTSFSVGSFSGTTILYNRLKNLHIGIWTLPIGVISASFDPFSVS